MSKRPGFGFDVLSLGCLKASHNCGGILSMKTAAKGQDGGMVVRRRLVGDGLGWSGYSLLVSLAHRGCTGHD